jgi:hypothetical protein
MVVYPYTFLACGPSLSELPDMVGELAIPAGLAILRTALASSPIAAAPASLGRSRGIT